MGEGGHTPGPWVARLAKTTVAIYPASGGRRITSLTVWDDVPLRPTAEANARLIAAAPDLLAALQEAIALLDDCEIAHPLRWESAISKATHTQQAGRVG